MWWVYAIQSGKDNRIYVGMSKDVDRRISEHNSKKVTSINRFQTACKAKFEANVELNP